MRKSAPLFCALLLSLSARRAWIEIPVCWRRCRYYWVALRKESVDRNKGSKVQKNNKTTSLSARRAWIEILNVETLNALACSSLSARRAWIEMYYGDGLTFADGVALRKESVDRNKYVVQCRKVMGVSLSARRAWIEMQTVLLVSVLVCRRSPQGERG